MIRGVMPAWLQDPIVLICAAILIFGMVGLFWAMSRFTSKKTPKIADPLLDDLPGDAIDRAPDDSLFRDPLAAPTPIPVPRVDSVPRTAAVPTNVADRLEQMSQRLVEMQTVLNKQTQSASVGGNAQIGQGFSPETVDKLLKIIGNVSQQVDILQKALNTPAASGSDKPAS